MSNPFEAPAAASAAEPAERLRKDAESARMALVLIPAGMCACYLTWPVALLMMARVWLRRRQEPFQPATPEQALLDRLVRTGIGVTVVCCSGLGLVVVFYMVVVGITVLGEALQASP